MGSSEAIELIEAIEAVAGIGFSQPGCLKKLLGRLFQVFRAKKALLKKKRALFALFFNYLTSLYLLCFYLILLCLDLLCLCIC